MTIILHIELSIQWRRPGIEEKKRQQHASLPPTRAWLYTLRRELEGKEDANWQSPRNTTRAPNERVDRPTGRARSEPCIAPHPHNTRPGTRKESVQETTLHFANGWLVVIAGRPRRDAARNLSIRARSSALGCTNGRTTRPRRVCVGIGIGRCLQRVVRSFVRVASSTHRLQPTERLGWVDERRGSRSAYVKRVRCRVQTTTQHTTFVSLSSHTLMAGSGCILWPAGAAVWTGRPTRQSCIST